VGAGGQQQGQQGTDRAGWVIDRHDGTFNAAASWVNIQNARAPNGEEDAANEPAEPAAVAEEMLGMGKNGGGAGRQSGQLS